MHRPTLIALIFIATYAGSASTSAQKVYRCGNTYSQIPCEGGKQLDTPPPTASTPEARKAAVDKENKRQVEAAKALETSRLALEAEGTKQHKAALEAMEKQKATKPSTPPADTKPPAAKQKKQKKPPEFFTAKPSPTTAPATTKP